MSKNDIIGPESELGADCAAIGGQAEGVEVNPIIKNPNARVCLPPRPEESECRRSACGQSMSTIGGNQLPACHQVSFAQESCLSVQTFGVVVAMTDPYRDLRCPRQPEHISAVMVNVTVHYGKWSTSLSDLQKPFPVPDRVVRMRATQDSGT
jgi:hypothetical protein